MSGSADREISERARDTDWTGSERPEDDDRSRSRDRSRDRAREQSRDRSRDKEQRCDYDSGDNSKEDNTQFEIENSIEAKLQEVRPTLGNKKHLVDVHTAQKPKQKPDEIPPQWAKQIYSMFESIRNEIAAVREDVLVLQSRIPYRLDSSKFKCYNPPPEAMDLEEPPRPQL